MRLAYALWIIIYDYGGQKIIQRTSRIRNSLQNKELRKNIINIRVIMDVLFPNKIASLHQKGKTHFFILKTYSCKISVEKSLWYFEHP